MAGSWWQCKGWQGGGGSAGDGKDGSAAFWPGGASRAPRLVPCPVPPRCPQDSLAARLLRAEGRDLQAHPFILFTSQLGWQGEQQQQEQRGWAALPGLADQELAEQLPALQRCRQLGRATTYQGGAGDVQGITRTHTDLCT